MQRDLDLFWDMLLQIERSPHSVHWYEIAIPGRTREQLAYHAKLAAEAGLIEARFLHGTPIFTVYRLTNEGHEFLDAARNGNVEQSKGDGVAYRRKRDRRGPTCGSTGYCATGGDRNSLPTSSRTRRSKRIMTSTTSRPESQRY